VWQAEAEVHGYGCFWFLQFFFRKKVFKISLCSLRISLMAMFGCTYVCEQFFSSMINKSALWSRLTSKRLNATLQLANTRDFKTNVDSLVSAKSAVRVSRRRKKSEVLNYSVYCKNNFCHLQGPINYCIYCILSSLKTMRPTDWVISCSVARTPKWVWDPWYKLYIYASVCINTSPLICTRACDRLLTTRVLYTRTNTNYRINRL